MKTIDIILLIILIFAAYRGFQKGFLMEIVTIVSLILGIIGGFKLIHEGMAFLDKHFDINGTLLPYLSFILIFIAIIILVHILGKVAKAALDTTILGDFDNLAGALTSVLKWAFILSVLLWISGSFQLKLPESATEGAFIYPIVQGFAPLVFEGMEAVFPFLEGLVKGIGDILSSDK